MIFFELLDVGALFAFAQLLLNGLDLLIQVVVALALFHLLLHAAADPLFDLENVDFGFQLREQAFEALGGADDLEHLLLLLEFQRKMRGDRVGQAAGVIDAGERGQDLRGDLLVEFYVLLELGNDRAAQGLGLGALDGVRLDRGDLAGEVRIGVFDAVDAGALGALDQHLDGAVGQLEHLQDAGDAADLVDVFGSGIILAGGFLGHQHDALARFHRNLERADGARTADEQRDDHVREHHDVAQRQQGKVDRVGRQGLAGRHRRFLGMTRRIGDRMTGYTRTAPSVTSVMGTIAENSRSRRPDKQNGKKIGGRHPVILDAPWECAFNQAPETKKPVTETGFFEISVRPRRRGLLRARAFRPSLPRRRRSAGACPRLRSRLRRAPRA